MALLPDRLDLADLQSVRNFAKQQQQELQSSKQPLRVLVNNAGKGCEARATVHAV
jgi:NAD(P)-dependent dehydrogenase (short-subunit alcohol dehydrogenase family)